MADDDRLSITLKALADPTRRALLRRLAQGEATVSELAAPFDISLPAISRHLKVLEEAGLIRGYHADLDERKLGYEVVCFAFVHLASQAEADLAAFQTRIREWATVRECWTLSGDIDFALKCVAPDLKAFQDFVADLTAMPNVRNVRTALTLDRVKDEPIVPFG